MLGVDHDVIGGAVFWAGLGFNGGGWLWRPVGVHTKLLGQMHVASLGSHLVWAAQPRKTLVCPEVNAPLLTPQHKSKQTHQIQSPKTGKKKVKFHKVVSYDPDQNLKTN